MRPLLCLITDRKRMGSERALLTLVHGAAHAGVHLIQVREPDLDGAALAGLVRACQVAVQGTRARVVVNERLDVALATAAHGVHLRGSSIDAREARSVCSPGFLIGRSTHTIKEVEDLTLGGGLDYLVFGPVCPTESKPGAPHTGIEGLTRAVRATPLPVLALGGVATGWAGAVAASGAAGIAAIGLWASARDLPATVHEVATAFDGKSR